MDIWVWGFFKKGKPSYPTYILVMLCKQFFYESSRDWSFPQFVFFCGYFWPWLLGFFIEETRRRKAWLAPSSWWALSEVLKVT